MLRIQVLGPSCGKCVRLESMVVEELQSLHIIDAEVEKISNSQLIERYLTDEPPGLLINGALFWGGGTLPEREQLRAWLERAVEGGIAERH